MVDRSSFSPVMEVTFYTENGNLVARSTSDPGSNIGGDIISVQTSRELGSDSPTFSINLTRRKEWDKWVGSNDLIKIDMGRPPEAKRTVFYGLVDDSRKNTAVAGNDVQRVISISGRGISKAFIAFQIGVVPETEYMDESIGWIEQNFTNGVTLAGSTGDKLIASMWDMMAKKSMDYTWSGDRKILDLAQRKLSFRPNTVLLSSMPIMNWQDSMWSFMRKVADEPFHEIYWEVYDNKPTLILRPTPFNKKDWDKLTLHYITDDVVEAESLGKSDVETYSLFSVGMSMSFDEDNLSKTAGMPPLWNKEFAKKYGIHRLDVETMYSINVDGGEDGVKALLESYREDVYNWNIKNNSFYNGSISVRGSSKYRIGERLSYKSVEDNVTREYYIQSVNHTFMNFGTWVTELGVTRGIVTKERFTAPVGQSTIYSGLGLTEYDIDKAQGNNFQRYKNNRVDSITGGFLEDASKVIAIGEGLIGKIKYHYGGPGIPAGRADCSQFTQWCFVHGAGIDIGRSTVQQIGKGTRVNDSEVSPGDLVFFNGTNPSRSMSLPSHVGLCLGNNKMVHLASRGVYISDIKGDSYWGPKFMHFRRYLTAKTSGISRAVVSRGKLVQKRVFSMEATAYGAEWENLGVPVGYKPTYTTRTGTTPLEGRTIAVDPNVIPLNSKIEIECSTFPSVNGIYIAEDTGGAIKGNRVDIYFNDMRSKGFNPKEANRRMLQFGRRHVKVILLG